ncbi:DNA-processing protein DprA [Yunchengibacter salinarum]|uniref:DNA-processing protein DprA n=1 Tax=Yunchengibacter salinarum TaxID=3133399 RepID=UPI0035B69AFF
MGFESMDAEERLARLRLIRTDSVGPITFRHLLARYGSARAALDAVPALAARGGRKAPPRIPDTRSVKQELSRLSALGGTDLHLGDSAYPAALAAVEDAPPVLFVLGHPHLLEKTCVGLVGARNASAAGQKMAATLAAGLAEAGMIVVSGLARGIDSAAHHAALDGGTVACVAGGVDVVYPRENQVLFDAMTRQGAVVSEMPMGTRPQARHFPRRNRLISGLSRGIVVIEAAERSGSLITARLAGEQGRDVFAVPGSPLDPRARGTNRLISEGATLVQTVDDIVEALAASGPAPFEEGEDLPLFRTAATATESDAPECDERAREVIAGLISPSPTPLDELIRLSGLPAGAVQGAVLELELAGLAERLPGGRVAGTG